jgi:hypothetical protein
MRRMFSTAVALVMLVGAEPAMAQDPVAGCGEGFTLSTLGDAIEVVDERIYSPEEWEMVQELIAAEDGNGDGFLCWKQFEPNQGQDKFWGAEDYVVTLILDNRAAGRGS